jgi:uncharacterized protein (DUF433 family)
VPLCYPSQLPDSGISDISCQAYKSFRSNLASPRPRDDLLPLAQTFSYNSTVIINRLNIADVVPLIQDDEGTIRVKGSRVTFDTVMEAFKEGDSPEQIQDSFPSLTLAQIYGAIAWYLNNQRDAEENLTARAAEGDAIRQQIENEPEYVAFRETMRQRREQINQG